MGNKKICALVLGGFVNGYSTIRELYDNEVRDIVLFEHNKSIAGASNKIKFSKIIAKNPESLKLALKQLRKTYNYIVIFPTSDIYLELLFEVYDEISEFCFIPINQKNFTKSIDKSVQYEFCKKLNIPYPQTRDLKDILDSGDINHLKFPLVIKPSKHFQGEPFGVLYLDSKSNFAKHKDGLNQLIQEGNKIIVSEFIQGDDTNLFSYMAYRSRSGEIINEFKFKKLTQLLGSFGVFSSVSNECPDIISEYGRKLFNEMDLKGICDAEFKYDPLEDSYKLMEINLRSVMPQRIGQISGVHLQYCQYLDAIGSNIPKLMQDNSKIIHLVYMKHELINLVRRKGYWKYFKHNLFGGDKRHFAILDISDPLPFLYEIILSLRNALARN